MQIANKTLPILVKSDASVNQSTCYGDTPLHFVTHASLRMKDTKATEECTTELLTAGANENIKNHSNLTPQELFYKWRGEACHTLNNALDKRSKKLAACKIQTTSRGFLARQQIKKLRQKKEQKQD